MSSTLKKRTCGFGIGTRFQRSGEEKWRSSKLKINRITHQIIESPDPGKYELRSDFDIGRPGTTNAVTKRGVYSIGIGRKYYEKVYSPDKTQVNDPNIPGPGTYDQKAKTLGTEGKRFKM